MGSRISSAKNRGEHSDRERTKTHTHRRDEDETLNDFARPEKMDIILDRPPLPRELQHEHAWNPNDRSQNIFVKEEDPFTLHRHPVAQSTDCIRGKMGYTRGFHVLELKWSTRQRGTHAVVGLATDKAVLHCTGYHSLVGSSEESWGWDLGRNKLFHNQKTVSNTTYPSLTDIDDNFIVPDTFRIILDMDEGTLAFEVDGKYLGVAFRGLKGVTVYPIISAVWGHCEITIKYIGGLEPEPQPLSDLCRRRVRKCLGKKHLTRDHVNKLPIPVTMKKYVLYEQ